MMRVKSGRVRPDYVCRGPEPMVVGIDNLLIGMPGRSRQQKLQRAEKLSMLNQGQQWVPRLGFAFPAK